MALSDKKLETFAKLFQRLNDVSGPERDTAIRLLNAALAKEKLSIHDLEFRLKGSGRYAHAALSAQVIARLQLEIADMKTTHAQMKGTIDQLTSALGQARSSLTETLVLHRDDADRLRKQIEQLASENDALRPKEDPWQPLVRQWLDDRPEAWRHTSHSILCGAIGIKPKGPAPELYRRLSPVMRKIGGWSESSNVPIYEGSTQRIKGWTRPRHG